MNEQVAGKLTLENELRLALRHGEFVLHYQPKVNLVTGIRNRILIPELPVQIAGRHPED